MPAAVPSSSARRGWLAPGAGLAIFLGCLWAYAPCLRGGRLWDDDAHLTPPRLAGAGGLRLIWTQVGATQQYYPVLHSAFWLEHRLWGDQVLGYHLLNVGLHGLAAVLFALGLARLLPAGSPPWAAWTAALLFAFHPVAVESVAWMAEQKNTLSLVFYLGAALAYLRFEAARRWRWYGVASLLFGLAVLTKSVTATLPAALLLVLAWRQRRRPAARTVLPLVPWLVCGLAAGLFTAEVERRYVGAQGAAYALSPLARVLLAGRVVWFYLGKLAWPHPLAFIYPRWVVRVSWAWATGAAATVLLLALLWRARRRTAAPLVALLFFLGSLLPALGFFNVYPFAFSYVADHWQYLPSLGFCALAGAGLPSWWARAPFAAARPGWRRGGAAVGLLALALLLGLARRQAALYRDASTLYADTLAKNPDCWMAANNLGLVRVAEGRPGEAEALYRRALAAKPDYADAHNNLGNLLAARPGQAAAATAEFAAAVRIQPGMTEAEGNLGWALANTPGRLAEGIAHLQTALAGHGADPAFARLFADLGDAEARLPGQLAAAQAAFETALRLDPAHPERRNDLGVALVRAHQWAAARDQFERLLAVRPNRADVRTNLGGVLEELGRPEEAADEYRVAITLDPNYPPAHFNLGRVLRRRRDWAGAEAELRAAARLAPDVPQTHYALALVLRAEGKPVEAAAEFARSGRSAP